MGILIQPDKHASALLQKQRFKVADVGAEVVFTIGNVELRLPYEAALDLSAILRMHAKRAKATAGDTSRNWRVVGILQNLTQ